MNTDKAEQTNKPTPKVTTDRDRLVGLRITTLRKTKGISQTSLGQALGVTFQQVQKYEKGQNRVGAGRLQDIADALDVPARALLEDADGEAVDPDTLGFLRAPGALELLRTYAGIQDAGARASLMSVARALSQGGALKAAMAR